MPRSVVNGCSREGGEEQVKWLREEEQVICRVHTVDQICAGNLGRRVTLVISTAALRWCGAPIGQALPDLQEHVTFAG